ncbi:MAG: hypothetical protein CFH22_01506 [Alphaproteobacteria bacterium MarineAlpha5_Bin12]|nr:MAG: hypothetical protein CFH22_01506 [Alphaproteobacteria bacterium MarineAlpha5_Bin12]|tara:strand:- start:6845 stop:7525 length:681 start_codon:yes stop_codon:yes gene_type:complete
MVVEISKMKTALIFGSSGLVGNNLLHCILKDNDYKKIKLFVRSNINIKDPRVEIIYDDFKNLDNIKNTIIGDDCFFCIGTTKKDTPDKKEYRRVEYDIPVTIARIAKNNSVNSFFYVSSIGANSKVYNSYLRNKGQVEEELIKLNFTKLGILRPALLLGKRNSFRLGERLAQLIMTKVSIIFIGKLKKFKPIKAKDVAKAIINITKNNYKIKFFESDKLLELSKPI